MPGVSRTVVGLRRTRTGRSFGYSQRLFSFTVSLRHPSEPCLILPRCPVSLCTCLPSLLDCDLQGGKDSVCVVHHFVASHTAHHGQRWSVGFVGGWVDPPGLSGLSEPPVRVDSSSLCRSCPWFSTVFGVGGHGDHSALPQLTWHRETSIRSTRRGC